MKHYAVVYKKLTDEEEEKWKYYGKVIEAETEEQAIHMIEACEGTEINILNIEEGK